MNVRVITSSAKVVAIATIYSLACSSHSPEAIGQSTSALSAGTNHFLSGGSLYGAHEVALAAGGNSDRPRWAAVFDPHDCGALPQGFCFNWAFSNDGQTWTAQPLLFQSQISPPPPELMSDNGTFAGWSGDPSLAAIHGPFSNAGRRMVVTNIANSSVANHTTEDVVIAVSNDDGATWGYPHIVTSPAYAGAGNGVDEPVVAAHTNDPYSVYVGWTNTTSPFISPGFISKVSYDLGNNFSATAAISIPQPGSHVAHVALDIGDVTNCDGQTHEAVFVVWADAGGRCTGDGTQELVPQIGWWLDVYDTVDGWAPNGPWRVESDADWPQCVGNPLPSGNAKFGDNSASPHIAVDPVGSSFSIVHTENSLFGSQTHIISGSMSCIGGVLQPVFTGGSSNPPPQCYVPATGCPPNPDGSPGPNGFCNGQPCFIVNDQWGPTVSFVRKGSTPQTLVTWYDTRVDQNNNIAGVWGMWSNDFGTTWSAPFRVSSATWHENLSWWWDYQALTGGPNGTFMAAWGGDARLGNGSDGVWSALIQ